MVSIKDCPRSFKISAAPRPLLAFPKNKWNKVSRKRPCPVCRHTDWCEISTDGQTIHCMRVESERPCKSRNGGYLHKALIDSNPVSLAATGYQVAASDNEQVIKAETEDQAEPLIIERGPAELLSAVYTELLSALNLEPHHLAKLTDPQGNRRLTEAQVEAMGIKSIPSPSAAIKICTLLQERYTPAQLASVPGFYLDNAGRVRMNLTNQAGLLIPIQPDGPDGYISGLRIRPDQTSKGGSKYLWFSSTTDTVGEPSSEGRGNLLG